MRRALPLLAAAWLAVATPPSAAGAEDAFELASLASSGRTVAAELADVDGDGRSDLVQVVYDGLPPNETRQVRVWLQRTGGGFGSEPDHVRALAGGSAGYDLADLDARPGTELVLLRREGLGVLSLADGSLREILLPDATTAAIAADERGLDRLELAREGDHGERWLVVPLLGETAVLSRGGDDAGQPLGRPRTGARANYFVPRSSGPPILESSMQIFYDSPVVETGDVDGDARTDLLSFTRHEVRVFLQRPDGRFPAAPDQTLALERLSVEDHIRASGTVSTTVHDVDADGRVDLIVTSAGGGLRDSKTRTDVHLNRGGTWNLREPDQVFEAESGFVTSVLRDVDGDGRQELIRIRAPLGILSMVRLLLTGALEAQLRIHRLDGSDGFAPEPAVRLDLDVHWSMDTFRPSGFLPDVRADVNGDGFLDLLGSNGGESIEVNLGGPDQELRKRVARQEADSRGRVRFGDADGDGLLDLVIYDPTRPDAPVWVARNAGRLPGTPPGMRAVGAR